MRELFDMYYHLLSFAVLSIMAQQVVAMDYGPQGTADVTENLLDSVPCGPVLHDPAESEQDSHSLPFLHLRAPFHPIDSPAVKEVPLTSLS